MKPDILEAYILKKIGLNKFIGLPYTQMRIMQIKYCIEDFLWAHKDYNPPRIGVSVTNNNIALHPLNGDDKQKFYNFIERLYLKDLIASKKIKKVGTNIESNVCIGDGFDGDGCGFVDGVSGGLCKLCGGMVLSQKALKKAEELKEAWINNGKKNKI